MRLVRQGRQEAQAATKNKTIALLLTILTFLPHATSADEKQVSVYAPVATYTLPVLERSGHEYIGLLELLEPVGRVSSESTGRHWKMRFNSTDAEFEVGRVRSRIRGQDFNLSAPFLLENSRGLVPLASLASLLPRFLGTGVSYHESARRLFIGDVGIHPSFQLETGTLPHLAVNFSGPVNPTISTEPGKVRMVFRRDPLLSPGSQSVSFESETFTQASYSESNGVAELDVAANIPLIATFSNKGKTITLSAAPTVANPSMPATKSPTTSAPAALPESPARAPAQASTPAVVRPLAIVDPAHGGEERGAALSDHLPEKDVTLGFARLLRHELEQRGFAVMLLRDSDATIPLDQRAAAANATRGVVYISLHAASQGRGTLVYTALMPAETVSAGNFHAWNSAQAAALPVSRRVAAAIVSEAQKKQLSARAASASLRPLNNLLMPAVTVELEPGVNGLEDLTSANYQQQAAAFVADALVAVRDQLGVQP